MDRQATLWTATLLFIMGSAARAEDWPTFRHDNHRSGRTPEQLSPKTLHLDWVWRSPQPPQPAWAGPAKWDAYAGLRGLRSMRDYDPVFHVIVAGEGVFFGSSADDSVRCLDARTGKPRWIHTTDGPVRIAPAFAGGRLYFGSDDGHAYCLNAADGALQWKVSPAPPDRRPLNNGRFISYWPCRTGVLVDGRTAYFAAGMLPWRTSYLCAVDAESGRAEAAGRYVEELSGMTMEGALLASSRHLFSPQGRVPPRWFDRTSGKSLGQLEGGGGSFVLLTDDARVMHGPGNKTGWITGSHAQSGEKIAAFAGGNAMVVAGPIAYLLTDHRLSALDRTTRKPVWNRPCEHPYSLILAGETLVAGGRDGVAAFAANDGALLWEREVKGKAYGLAVAGGGLFVSTDEGAVYCFRPGEGPGSTAQQGPADEADTPGPTTEPDDRPRFPIPPCSEQGLLGRWVFQGEGIQGATIKDLAGRQDGTIDGTIRLATLGDAQALRFDGQLNSVSLAEDHNTAKLPDRAITAEAWVRIDQPLRWGGIVGVVQDNGSFERGWILGYEEKRFNFAVAAREGPGRLTYLNADVEFEPGRGHHVVGTYDGVEQKIYVDGELRNTSTGQKGDVHYPPKAFFEIGAYRDDDEFYRLTGMVHEVRLYDRALSAEEIREHHGSTRVDWPKPAGRSETVTLAVGPYLQFTGPGRATVRWQTAVPSPTILEYKVDGQPQRIEDARPKLQHEARLVHLRKRTIYPYAIKIADGGVERATAEFPCDTFFNFSPADVARLPNPFSGDEPTPRHADVIQRALSEGASNRGICLVLGIGRGRLAYELARRSQLQVIGVDTDARRVASARQTLVECGVYGARVAVHQVDSYAALPLVGEFADLVVSDAMLSGGPFLASAAEVLRLLRPGGGRAVLGGPGAAPEASPESVVSWLKATVPDVEAHRQSDSHWTVHSPALEGNIHRDGDRLTVTIRRRPLAGAGVWTHQYGTADNSAFGGESLGGARATGDLAVQWLGRPGPRAQADRNGRKPSPLSVGGWLFVQGLHRIIALDGYNGAVHWSLEIPPLERFNVPRDSSNWCAAATPGKTAADIDLFVAIRDKCWQIDGRSGQVKKFHDVVPGEKTEWSYDWGYVAAPDGAALVGSAVKSGASWTDFWGGTGWYDAKTGEVTHKVCSENLFSIEPGSGNVNWTYSGGAIVNPTITIQGGRVYFVECRNAKVLQSDTRRVGMPELWHDQFLVALDLATGAVDWARPIDTADGDVVFYLAAGGDKLVLVSSDQKYHVYAFEAGDGRPAWETQFDWPGKDHGKHMSRPAIGGGNVFVRPQVIDLATGEFRKIAMPAGGCGTYALTRDSVIFRAGNVTMWDPGASQTTAWSRLRPGCWLSTIPAGGMLLSPEAGGGCSCGSWLETSLGFIPVASGAK